MWLPTPGITHKPLRLALKQRFVVYHVALAGPQNLHERNSPGCSGAAIRLARAHCHNQAGAPVVDREPDDVGSE